MTKKVNILLVEDEALIGALLEEELLDLGFNVSYAPRLGKARELMAKENFDLIISDNQLPDGLSEKDFYPSVRHERKDVPFIMVSGQELVNPETGKGENFLFIRKPAFAAALAPHIARMVSANSMQASAAKSVTSSFSVGAGLFAARPTRLSLAGVPARGPIL